jgi:hypothetical protein
MARTMARMSPEEMSTYLGAKGGEMLGRGAVQTGAAALGYDARSPGEQEDDAVAAAKRQVQQLGFDPEKPESIDQFYRQVIGILQRQGLVAQAMQVAKEYQTQKAATTRANAETSKAEAAKARAAQLGPRLLQLMDALEAAQTKLAGTPEEDPAYAALEQRVAMLTSAIEKEGVQKGIKVVNAGNKVQIVDSKTGDPIREIAVGAKPKAPGTGTGEKPQKSTQLDRDRARYRELMARKDELSEDEKLELKMLENKLKMGEDEGRIPPAEQAAKIGTAISNMREFVDLSKRFRKDFSGGTFAKIAAVAGLENQLSMVKRMAGSNPVASAWWQNYYELIAAIRNALFGASLTGSEGIAFDQIKTSPGDEPNMVLQIMRQQAEFARNSARGKAEGLQAGGYNAKGLVQALDAMAPVVASIPARVAGAPAPLGKAAPTPAPAPAAAPKEPGKPVTPQPAATVRVQAPDGRTGTIPRANLEAALAKGYKEIK